MYLSIYLSLSINQALFNQAYWSIVTDDCDVNDGDERIILWAIRNTKSQLASNIEPPIVYSLSSVNEAEPIKDNGCQSFLFLYGSALLGSFGDSFSVSPFKRFSRFFPRNTEIDSKNPAFIRFIQTAIPYFRMCWWSAWSALSTI